MNTPLVLCLLVLHASTALAVFILSRQLGAARGDADRLRGTVDLIVRYCGPKLKPRRESRVRAQRDWRDTALATTEWRR